MPEKLYYTIGEVAEMFKVNASLIRFWEKEFPILSPRKNKKGNRLFTARDIDNLRIIYHLLKERGFTIEGAKKNLAENKKELDNHLEIVKSMQRIKKYLLDLSEELP